MRFVDSNVFVHAFLKPRRALSDSERKLKDDAKKIVTRISSGEEVMTSVVHLAEVANILEDSLPAEDSLAILRAMVMGENVAIEAVSRDDCASAVAEMEDMSVGLNDSIAHVVMRRKHLREVYSFDRDFDRFADLKRLTA